MTSCASVRTVSDFIENTIPNAIANYTKDAILPSQDASDGNQQNNTDTQTNTNTIPSKDDSEIDYPQLINLITTSTIKACVNITTNEYRSASSTMPLKSSVGSGVIFKADKKSSKVYRYYVLTNYHVVDLSDEYPYYSYIITDYQGNEYRASSPSWVTSTSVQKLCKEHDLAILEFETQNVLKTRSGRAHV